MFQFPGFASRSLCIQDQIPCFDSEISDAGSTEPPSKIPPSKVGCPIRKSTDQSLFAAPHGLSQRTTSFIASYHQGIHQMPLSRLIALIINAPPSAEVWSIDEKTR